MNSGIRDEGGADEKPSGGIGIGDILYTLFRYKYLLLGSVVMGVMAAGAIVLVRPPTYESTAKIYVPYVISITPVNPRDRETDVTPTIVGENTVINTEIEMLRSFDTAKEVAARFGPARILARYGSDTNLLSAASVIASGIKVAPPRAMFLSVTLSHRDPDLVQPLLEGVVEAYMRRHRDLRIGDTSNYVEQAEQAARRISDIDHKLKELRTSAGVPDIRARQTAITKEYADLQSQVLRAQTELARLRAGVGDSKHQAVAGDQADPLTAETISLYSDVLTQIQESKQRRQRAMVIDDLTTNHPTVLKLDLKIQEHIRQKLALEKQYPTLTNYVGTVSRGGASSNGVTRLDLESELASIDRLARTLQADETMLTNLTQEAFRLMELEPKVAELERLRAEAETDYEFFRGTSEKSKVENKSSGGMVNMQKMESPTPPKLDRKKMLKLLGVGFGGCVGMGLFVAFGMDLFLDRSIRRPAQVNRRLQLPVILTIPDANKQPSAGWPWQRRKNLKVMRPDKTAESANALAHWSPDHKLQTDFEGLRERVITHFEAKDFDRHPRLVGITACAEGAGVSTLASGLAASLSRTGRGSVLLVDWNTGQGVTHSFYKGKAGYGPSESFEAESDSDLEVSPSPAKNLSLTKHQGEQSSRDRLAGMLPPDFDEYMPKLKADAYDYIVFDMPCITPASTSPRMAGRMDLVLFVIESEKTKDYVARYASGLMRESRANVVAILNKFYSPVPEWLSQD